ncbi:MAG: hypothetical protein HOL16_08390 [Alphaproteobacteria bacterium]|jgi:hypothetical protein|nr:hypothetical protein [Alphaproteobacteria bacterium]
MANQFLRYVTIAVFFGLVASQSSSEEGFCTDFSVNGLSYDLFTDERSYVSTSVAIQRLADHRETCEILDLNRNYIFNYELDALVEELLKFKKLRILNLVET